MMLFISGTTSAPKIVVLSHANLSAQIAAFGEVYDYDADSRILNPLPVHFTDGMLHGPIIAFVSGAALFRLTRFDFQAIEALVHSIYRDRITHFIVVPALLSMLDRLGDAVADTFEGRDFRYIRSSGDALPEALWRAIERRFKVRVVNAGQCGRGRLAAAAFGSDQAGRPRAPDGVARHAGIARRVPPAVAAGNALSAADRTAGARPRRYPDDRRGVSIPLR